MPESVATATLRRTKEMIAAEDDLKSLFAIHAFLKIRRMDKSTVTSQINKITEKWLAEHEIIDSGLIESLKLTDETATKIIDKFLANNKLLDFDFDASKEYFYMLTIHASDQVEAMIGYKIDDHKLVEMCSEKIEGMIEKLVVVQ